MEKKEQLQQDIAEKNKALEDLKAQVLTTQEDKEKNQEEQKKLEEEIKTLEEKLEELENLETTSTVTTTQEEINTLRNNVEVDSDWTYELIK
jgi:chromosome segregation ATPase